MHFTVTVFFSFFFNYHNDENNAKLPVYTQYSMSAEKNNVQKKKLKLQKVCVIIERL